MRKHKLNSSADVDRYLNIKSMDGDSTKYAYSLEITSENSRSIYAESDVYGWTYRVDKNTTAVWQNGKKLADRCTYSIDEYFDVERPVNSSKRSKKLNSAVDKNGNVTLTIPYYIWRLVYTCVFGYSERFDSELDGKLLRIINKLESALHGTWDTLHINRDPDGEKIDFYFDTNTRPGFEAVELTANDKKSVAVTFTAQECQVLYRCLDVMAEQYADNYTFSDDDLDEIYPLYKYIEGQLQMTGRQIIDATAFETEFDSSRRGAKMIKTSKKLNSATNAQFNEKAFDHYLKNLVADCVEYATDHGDPVQVLVHQYPGYDWRWAAEGTDLDWDLARKELEDALYKYLKIQYLAYK